jgi:hypothetical protein
MILYHFTNLAKMEAILTEGLRNDLGANAAPPIGVVWLTRSEIPNWLTDPRHLDCGLKLSVPNGDKRLVKWGPWLRKHLPGSYEAVMNYGPCKRYGSLDTTWIYFGTIEPSAIRHIVKNITYDMRVVDDDGVETGETYDEAVARHETQAALAS